MILNVLTVNKNEVAVKGNTLVGVEKRIDILGLDIATLKDKEWLNDSIIAYYTSMIESRSRENNRLPKVSFLNVTTFTKT